MGELRNSIQKNIKAWKEYYDSSNPHAIPCPAPMDKLKDLQRLIAVRCLRPDKVVPAVAVSIFFELTIIV